MFTPNSTIKLLSVPLTMGDGKQMDFTNAAAQTAYFQAHSKFTYTQYNYQRQDRAVVVSIPGGVDALLHCNYMMYQNTNFTNKWFYAYITKKEWVSENAARLYLKTDVFQTWLFAFSFKQCYVLRETVSDDTKFKHTVPEHITFGNAKPTNNRVIEPSGLNMNGQDAQNFGNNFYAVFIMSEQARYISESNLPLISYVGGGANACYFYAMPITSVPQFISKVNENGQQSAIVTGICVPKNGVIFHSIESSVPGLGYVTGVAGNVVWEYTANKSVQTISGYTPKNNKLFSYPYNYDMLYTGNQQQIIRYEYFNAPLSDSYKLRIYFMLASIPIYGVIPESYDGKSLNEQCGLQLQNFPPMAWNNDFFANYLSLHAFSMATNAIGGAARTIFPMSAPIGSGAGLTEQAANLGANMLDMANIPQTTKGDISGNYAVHTGTNHIYLCTMQIRAEYAKIVDDYFTRFGYQINELKTPTMKNRKLFDYLKTADCKLYGDIPQDDEIELEEMFNTGITVWHAYSDPNYNNFGNYGGDNSPR